MSRRRPSRWHGLLPVLKAAGPTSHDIVDIARKALHERRIGHTGTLDPMAEGMLLLCIGQATRLQQYLLSWDKTYAGVIRLGQSTTTYDVEGAPTEPSGPVPELRDDRLRELEAAFSGEIDQVPPPFSAKKVDGKRLYELARSGHEVQVDPKRVTVHELRLELEGADVLRFTVRTSSGFYVRSLANDLGRRLGCGGHLVHLERLCIGPYDRTTAVSQPELEATSDPREIVEGRAWVPLPEIQLPYPRITLNPGAEDRFNHGGEVIVLRQDAGVVAQEDLVSVHGHTGGLLGIGGVVNVLARGRTVVLRPRMVISTSTSGRQA
ncbi:MAG: tRNA pseudouridine(55) synthase TruB [Acidobacteria bacterium]|jgi:tRNA pseudouridine55 synthase|nr:tRNA pseudouridine(55) synthase TruB [Acidobacteriota bacterium]